MKPGGLPDFIGPAALPVSLVATPWTSASFLQGSTVVPFAIVALGTIVLTFHPNLISKLKPQNGCSRESWIQASKVVFLCATYMIVGPLLMVLNKEILQTLHFDFPLTLSGLGLTTTAIVVHSLVHCGICEIRPQTREAMAGNMWFRTVLPIAVAKATTLACGNAVYLYLGLGFIQMLKALNPVIVVGVMSVCGLQTPSRLARWGVYLILCGTMLEVRGELHATLFGLTLMLLSELMEAIHLVLTQKLLQISKFTLAESLYLIALPAGSLLLCAAAVAEWPRLGRDGGYLVIAEHPLYFVASSCLGLAVNFTGAAVLQATSAVTTKVLNTLRGIGVVFVGILFYGEYCTTIELLGYSVAIAGFSLYNWAQFPWDEKPDGAKSEARLPAGA